MMIVAEKKGLRGGLLAMIRRTVTRYTQQSKTPVSSSQHFLPLRKRSAIELAGLFLLVCTLAIVGITTRTPSTTHGVSNSKQAKATTSSTDSNQTAVVQSSSLPATNTQTTTQQTTDTTTSTSSPGSSTTHITSSTSNGSTSTELTVNGKQISVPANGSVNETVGNTSVDLSNTQNSTGNATNLNENSTSTNVSNSNSLNYLNYEGDNQAP
jgi:cytoskeletal protein RodZ